jgi:hypothetical protein
MSSNLAFSPIGNSITVAATTTSVDTALPGSDAPAASLRVINASAAVAAIRYGAGAQTAVLATDLPVNAGSTEVFNIPVGVTNVAVILASGTGNVYFTRGGGL